jgi:hypothetical protein
MAGMGDEEVAHYCEVRQHAAPPHEMITRRGYAPSHLTSGRCILPLGFSEPCGIRDWKVARNCEVRQHAAPPRQWR